MPLLSIQRRDTAWNQSSCSQLTRFHDTRALTVHRAGIAFNRAPKPQAIPGVSFISSRSNVAGRRLRAAATTHPAVIWQSHLLDVTPQQWNSLKVTFITLGMHILDILQGKTASYLARQIMVPQQEHRAKLWWGAQWCREEREWGQMHLLGHYYIAEATGRRAYIGVSAA